MPFTFHVTAVLVVFVTVAVNWRVVVMRTLAVVGEMVMLTTGGGGGLVTLTEALPLAAGTALLVACTVTVAGDGRASGAV